MSHEIVGFAGPVNVLLHFRERWRDCRLFACRATPSSPSCRFRTGRSTARYADKGEFVSFGLAGYRSYREHRRRRGSLRLASC
jgi:hypothetical protein